MESCRSWLVLSVVLLTNILTLGFIFGVFGVYVQFYNDYFAADNSVTGWIGSVASGFMLGFCKFTNFLSFALCKQKLEMRHCYHITQYLNCPLGSRGAIKAALYILAKSTTDKALT